MDWRDFFKDSAFYYSAYNIHGINQNFGSLNETIKEFADQSHRDIQQLTSVIQENLSSITLELTLHTKLFRQILEVMKNKTKSEAEEHKNFGLNALKHGWLDDAENDFLESIRINRYDYQVYYLLSKVYAQKGDFNNQGENLKKAYDYSGEDEEFKEYVLLDVVILYLQLGETTIAKSILESISLRGRPTFITCLMRVILDIKINSVSDETYQNIEKAIDFYDSDEPIRIMQVIEALKSFLSDDQAKKVENTLNKNKHAICIKFGLNFLIRIQNLIKIIYHLKEDKEFIKNIVPEEVSQKVFPNFFHLNILMTKLEKAKEKLQNVVLADYDKLLFLATLLQNSEHIYLKFYNLISSYNHEGRSFNSKPFERPFKIDLDFDVGKNDKIILQLKLDSGEYLILTYFKFMIMHDKRNIITYDLYEDFSLIEQEFIKRKQVEFENYEGKNIRKSQTEEITFLLRDIKSGSIISLDKCSSYSAFYGSGNKMTNLLTLFFERAKYINSIITSLKMIEQNTTHINLLMDYFNDTKQENPIHSPNDEIEFID